jgi:hypothetical protein
LRRSSREKEDLPADRPAPLLSPEAVRQARRRSGRFQQTKALVEDACEVVSHWICSRFDTWLASISRCQQRGLFDHKSIAVRSWDRLLALGAFYTIFYVPMHLVFRELRELNQYWVEFDVLLDVLFTADLVVKARTSYVDHGYTIAEPKRVMQRYLRSWFVIDLVSSLPFDWMLEAAHVPWASSCKLFALLRIFRVVRANEGNVNAGANWIRIVEFIGGFIIIGHWLGLLWYVLALTIPGP